MLLSITNLPPLVSFSYCVMLFFYAAKTIHTSWLVRTLSQSSVNKTPSRETVYVLHQCSGHWQVSGMWLWAEKKNGISLSSWLQASGLHFRRMLELETSEVVPALNLRSACLPCCRVLFVFFFCVWVNCSSGGIPAPPETCVLCFTFLFFNPHFTLPFVLLILTATPTHRPVVTVSQLLSALVGETWMHLCVLQGCL